VVVFTWYKKTLVVLSYLDQVGGVMSLLDGQEFFLDTAGIDKPVKQIDATSFVVSPTSSRSSEGLLANNGASAFGVDVEVTGSASQLV